MEHLGKNKMDYPEFKKPLGQYGFSLADKDKVLKYIACVYDKNSPFRKDFQDINQRKIAACLYVGFEADERGRFAEHVEMMMLCKNEDILDMIVRYCRNYRNLDYSLLVALWDDYFRKIKDIHNPNIDYKISDITKLREEIVRLSEIFTVGDDSQELLSNLYKHLEEDSLKLRPEDIAAFRRDGISPISDEDVSEYKSEYIKDVPSAE